MTAPSLLWTSTEEKKKEEEVNERASSQTMPMQRERGSRKTRNSSVNIARTKRNSFQRVSLLITQFHTSSCGAHSPYVYILICGCIYRGGGGGTGDLTAISCRAACKTRGQPRTTRVVVGDCRPVIHAHARSILLL